MSTFNWQLPRRIHNVIFDCDGTLSTIEGIDELARMNGVGEQVEELTHLAMAKSGLTSLLYRQRLDLIQPSQQQVNKLAQIYYENCVPDIKLVIRLLQKLNKNIFIVSAGILQAVLGFGKLLNITQENIYAVNIEFTTQGEYLNFDHESPLIHNQGKKELLNRLNLSLHETVYVGDGLNDLVVYDLVKRFIGYGGTFYRKNIADRCEFYIDKPTTTPLLPLILTAEECEQLASEEFSLYQEGLKALSHPSLNLHKLRNQLT